MADGPTNRTKRSRQQAKSRPPSRRPASKPAVKGRPSATRTKGRTRKAVTAAKARKRRTVIFTVMIGLALAGFLFAFVYPTRTYLDQRQQIQWIFAHFQHVIALGQRLGIRTFLHHRVMTLAADRQSDQFQTTLANHLDLNLELAVNTHSAALATFEDQLRVDLAGLVRQRVAQSLETGQRHLPFQGGTAIGEFARINVRWNRPIQHRRDILGTAPSPVKGISALSAVGARL